MGEEDDGLSRRDLFKKAAAGVVGAAAMLGGAEAAYRLPERDPYRIERFEHATRIRKAEGTYDILYGAHLVSGEEAGFLVDIDGIFLEGSGDYIAHPEEAVSVLEDKIQYAPLVRAAEERDLPLYLADVGFEGKVLRGDVLHDYLRPIHLDAYADEIGLHPVLLGEATLIGAEFYLGRKLLEQVAANPDTTRRALLKNGVKAAAITWLMLPFTSFAWRGFSHFSGSQEGGKHYRGISHAVHAEDMPLTEVVRDTVMAHKERWLMERHWEEQTYATVIGGMHSDLEDRIVQTKDEHLAVLDDLQPLIEKFCIPETVYSIVKYEFDQKYNIWEVDQIYEVPELQALV